MRILMIAPPGAGKGTQGALIASHFGIPHIASGDILRDHIARRTDIGRAAEGYLNRGELVPDEIMHETIRQAFIDSMAYGSYVLDGMPRTIEQAREIHKLGLDLGMEADIALHLQADDAEVTRRMLARASVDGRSDDTAPVIEERLRRYHEVTEPVTAWYRLRGILVSVDAMRPIDVVAREILVTLEVMRPMIDYIPARMRRPIDLTTLDRTRDELAPTAPVAGITQPAA
ncbi:adenylate kinase family protein [Dactylosporangium darangshiense]|uniref:Adenylate kinase n=1 Tax=Dactylosporangium darangshiense TaxID=579108 RepID=A0ABP8DBT5_9ACTN